MSSENSDHFTSPFPVWVPFISVCFLIAEATSSNMMLNNSHESGHPGLLPYLRRKSF